MTAYSTKFLLLQKVFIRGNIPATITSIRLFPGRSTYEVAWWNDHDRKEAWLEEFEIKEDIK